MGTSLTGLIRELKGSPLSVLCAMMVAGQPVGEQWLIAATGYSPPKVREGLNHLAEIQLVCRNGRYQGWVLMAGAEQLPFSMDLVTKSVEQLRAFDPNNKRERKNFALPSTTTTTTTDSPSVREEAAVENCERKKNAIESLEVLHELGIMGRTAERLVRLSHMEPDYIRAHHNKWLHEKKPIGILICRLQDGDPYPEACSNGYEYISGPLREFIEY